MRYSPIFGAFFLVIMIESVRSLKVLALHGSGNTGMGWKARMEPVVSMLETQFSATVEFADAPFPKGNGRCWWTFTHEERSMNAKRLVGLEESLASLRDKQWDVLLGHSQGAMIAGILLATERSGKNTAVDRNKHPRAAILSGAAYPQAADSVLQGAKRRGIASRIASLHVIGAADTVNPPTSARRLANVFDAQVLEHPGGHVFPTGDGALEIYQTFLRRALASQG